MDELCYSVENCKPEVQGLCGSDSSITGDLTRKKQRLETQLSEVNAALDALKANPELTKFLELVSKARH